MSEEYVVNETIILMNDPRTGHASHKKFILKINKEGNLSIDMLGCCGNDIRWQLYGKQFSDINDKICLNLNFQKIIISIFHKLHFYSIMNQFIEDINFIKDIIKENQKQNDTLIQENITLQKQNGLLIQANVTLQEENNKLNKSKTSIIQYFT